MLPIGLTLGTAMAAASALLAGQRTSRRSVLRAALKRKEFVLYCQPIVELASVDTAGVESLLRWPANRPVGMWPALLIQTSAGCGLAHRSTEYVLGQVAIDGPRFFRVHPGASTSIDLSSVDLDSDGVIHWLRRLVSTPGIAPCNIVVAVTAPSFVAPASASRTIDPIRTLGVHVSIDDFASDAPALPTSTT